MSTRVRFFLHTGVLLVFVGLVSIPSPFALQWLATIGIIFLVFAGISNLSKRLSERRMKRLMGNED